MVGVLTLSTTVILVIISGVGIGAAANIYYHVSFSPIGSGGGIFCYWGLIVVAALAAHFEVNTACSPLTYICTSTVGVLNTRQAD